LAAQSREKIHVALGSISVNSSSSRSALSTVYLPSGVDVEPIYLAAA
jgi:hypothetical protein